METCCQPTAIHEVIWPCNTFCAFLEPCPNAEERTDWVQQPAKPLSSLWFLLNWGTWVEEQTGVGTDGTPGSSYQQQGGQGHLGRLQLTTKHLWTDLMRQKPLLFLRKRYFNGSSRGKKKTKIDSFLPQCRGLSISSSKGRAAKRDSIAWEFKLELLEGLNVRIIKCPDRGVLGGEKGRGK